MVINNRRRGNCRDFLNKLNEKCPDFTFEVDASDNKKQAFIDIYKDNKSEIIEWRKCAGFGFFADDADKEIWSSPENVFENTDDAVKEAVKRLSEEESEKSS